MKTALALSCLALVAGCASTPRSGPAEWGYKPGQSAPSVISDSEFEQTTGQIHELMAQRSGYTTALRTAPDADTRARYLRNIDDLNGRIRMLEYRLRAANRPVPGG